jgi:hypothetical protein
MSKPGKAEMLRQRIALYRGYLRDGVDASLARAYLKEIARAETALAALVDNHEKRPNDKSGA